MMRKKQLLSAFCGVFLVASIASAASVSAELYLQNGSVWRGKLMGREGNWVQFVKSGSGTPLRLAVNTISKIRFAVPLKSERISKFIRERDFENAIKTLQRALEPFKDYEDIPSNLTRYKVPLMDLLYKAGRYDEALEIANKLVQSRDKELRTKARVYQLLALVDAGRVSEAEKAMKQYGWDKIPGEDEEVPADRLFVTAKYLRAKKEFKKAIELAARVVVLHSQEPDWVRPAELLCAELYADMGMFDSAEEVCREIRIFYKDTPEYDAADRLRLRIDKLRAQQQLKESLKSQ